MKPSQLALSLKRIASQIEASKKPNKELVIRDLKKILAAFDEGGTDEYSPEELGTEILQGLERIQDGQNWLVGWHPYEDSAIIEIDSGPKTISAIYNKTDEDGNVIKIRVPFTLTPGTVVRTLEHRINMKFL